MLVYNSATGSYKGTISAGQESVPAGSYRVRIKIKNYLGENTVGMQQIVSGQVNKIPTFTFVAGDADDDNKLSVLDYNIITKCYSYPGVPTKCSYADAEKADVDSNGKNDEADILLFIRELSVQSGDN
jgi:hypothetical protein